MSASTGKRRFIPQIYTARRRNDDVPGSLRVYILALMRKAPEERLVRQPLARNGSIGLMTPGRYIPQGLRSTLRSASRNPPLWRDQRLAGGHSDA